MKKLLNRKECPEHKVVLIACRTRYGTRWARPEADCTVVCWGGSTSTPADQETRDARQRAHAAFDPLWQSGRMRRKDAYRKLADFLGIGIKQTHIGMFDKEQCEKVVEFVGQVTN